MTFTGCAKQKNTWSHTVIVTVTISLVKTVIFSNNIHMLKCSYCKTKKVLSDKASLTSERWS